MDGGRLEEHLKHPVNRGPVPAGALVGSAGGAACGDLVRIAVRVEQGTIAQASFDAHGCAAAIAAGSACVSLIDGARDIDAARVGVAEIATELGGLSPGKLHAAELASDALHRALAGRWRSLVEGGRSQPPVGDRVLVAMSGGVDSAVAALLTMREGRDVAAVTLKLWADEVGDAEKSCCSPRAVIHARALAHSLGMPHLTLDLEPEFRASVVDDFIAEHEQGRTPNPCVRCNGHVRFDSMLDLGVAIGAHTLVTGHYARVDDDDEGPLLAPAHDDHKDQTYMLSALRPELLGRLRFPLADMKKPQVRRLAREASLPVADRPESQDLCFLAGTQRERFLARHGGPMARDGDVVNSRGAVIGRHGGYSRFTVGQRRGLGVAHHEPLFVLATDARTNRVIAGTRRELATRTVALAPVTLHRGGDRIARVKLRYRSSPVACTSVDRLDAGFHRRVELSLSDDVLGVAPGQVACLLDSRDRVIGHGVIDASAVAA
ncbi:MAG: tRNA 2-thiouridine(34) synthase MnmA [Solirubrobacterales bacterium]